MTADPNRLEKLCCAGPVVIRARGDSMGRRYVGEVAFRVRPLTRRRPLPGTLLAWQDARGTIVVHRLLLWARRFGAFRYYTKGDANPGVDPSIVPDRQFVAEVMSVILDDREIRLDTPARRIGGLFLALAALPRAAWLAWKPRPRAY